MHHQVGVGDRFVDLGDAADRQHFTGGLAGELVGAVAGADGDRQGINLGFGDEISSFSRVGEQLGVVEGALEAVAVFRFALAGFQGAEAAELAFDTDADGVSHVHHFLGDGHVVVVAGRGLGIGFQGAVHHHGGETVGSGAVAGGGAVAVVLVHHHRDVGISFDRSQDQVAQEAFAGVLAGAAGGLQDDGAVRLGSRLHDGLHLLQVVDVEGRNAVAVLGGVVKQQPKRDERHGKPRGSG